mgnify:CR=1 FL=1
MSGFGDIERVTRFLDKVKKMGFVASYSRTGVDFLSLRPAEDHYPIYSRNSELFSGTMEAAEYWLLGIEWAREYDRLINVSNNKRRAQREQAWRNQDLIKILSDQNETKK